MPVQRQNTMAPSEDLIDEVTRIGVRIKGGCHEFEAELARECTSGSVGVEPSSRDEEGTQAQP